MLLRGVNLSAVGRGGSMSPYPAKTRQRKTYREAKIEECRKNKIEDSKRGDNGGFICLNETINIRVNITA